MSVEYDSDSPDDGHSRSGYLSKKDFKVLGIVLVLLGLLAIPVFRFLREQAQQATCSANLNAINMAIGVYAALNEDQFPPAYATASDGGDAYVDAKLRPYTWVSLVQQQLSTRHSFVCPAGSDAESVENQSGIVGGVNPMSNYGMYIGASAARMTTMASPGQTILISETSSQGSNDTYDPLPMKDGSGNLIPDGFVIGYDNDQRIHDKQTRFVTRLAYNETKKGDFLELKQGRHQKGNHFLFADGHLETLRAPVARVRHLGIDILSPWMTR